jgi:hypothetical protein
MYRVNIPSKDPRRCLRSERGIWLATVVSLGMVSLLCLMATTALVVDSYGRVTNERTRDVMRNCAETSLDWAVNQFNDQATRPNIDTAPGTTKTISVPSSILMPNYTGSVRVQTGQPPTYTYLYNSSYDPTLNGNILGDTNFRILTASVTAPSGRTKSLRVPETPVTLNGNSPVYGSVVCKSVTLNGSCSFIYDEALRLAQGLTWLKPVTVTSTTTTISQSTASVFNHYQAVSWEEI